MSTPGTRMLEVMTVRPLATKIIEVIQRAVMNVIPIVLTLQELGQTVMSDPPSS